MSSARVDEQLLSRLVMVVGERFVITTHDELEPYSHDETQGLAAFPEVVVRPGSTEEVSKVLSLAWEAGVSVTPRGAGTGKSGAAVPTESSLVLSLERLNRILEIDPANGFAVVEPGVITEELQGAAEEHGLFYAPDPASKGSCHVGGNIQTNAGGMRAVKYGVTSDHVYGLTFVLPNGQVIESGGKNVKDSSGYGLARMIVGSEGTLAVVTQAILRLLPLPTTRAILLAPFPELEVAAEGVNAVFRSGVIPSALEIMDRHAVSYASRHQEKPFPFPDAAAQLLVEVDGDDPEQVGRDLERVGETLLETGAEDVLLAQDRRRQEELWQVRRVIAEGLKQFTTYRGVDAVVPRARIVDLVRLAREAGAKQGLDVVCFGHAGDGNIHVNLVRTEAQETED
ncbi:MAG: FAD-binding oxidoreductase, partial [Planctomycetota bacterium]